MQGERLRRELLREAEELESRYDTLLAHRKADHGLQPVEEARPSPPIKIRFRLGSGSRTPSHDGHQPHHVSRSSLSQVQLKSEHSPRPKVFPSQTRSRSKSSPSSPTLPLRPSLSDLSYEEVSHRLPHNYIPDILRVAAPVNASRTTLRIILPFGVKIPNLFDEQYDFNLPSEVLELAAPNPSRNLELTSNLDEVVNGDDVDSNTSENEALGLIYSPIEDD